MKRNLLLAAAAILVLTVSRSVDAAVLLTDSFARTTGVGDGNTAGAVAAGTGSSDLGSNDNAAGGTIVGAYTTSTSRGGGANVTSGTDPDFPGNGSVATFFNQGFVLDGTGITAASPDGFTVGFDFDRIADPGVTSGGPNGYLAFGVGAPVTPDPATIGAAYAISGNTAFAALFQQSNNGNIGNAEVFENGAELATGSDVDYGDPTATHSVLLTLIPQLTGAFNSVGDVISYDLAVDGSSISSGSFTNVDGDSLDGLAFSTNLFSGTFIDNLAVNSIETVAIPEPTSLGALAVLGLAGVVRRRRR